MESSISEQLQEKIWILHQIALETREFINKHRQDIDPVFYSIVGTEVMRTEVKFRQMKNKFDSNVNIIEMAKKLDLKYSGKEKE